MLLLGFSTSVFRVLDHFFLAFSSGQSLSTFPHLYEAFSPRGDFIDLCVSRDNVVYRRIVNCQWQFRSIAQIRWDVFEWSLVDQECESITIRFQLLFLIISFAVIVPFTIERFGNLFNTGISRCPRAYFRTNDIKFWLLASSLLILLFYDRIRLSVYWI